MLAAGCPDLLPVRPPIGQVVQSACTGCGATR
jgi:hypothetical protein